MRVRYAITYAKMNPRWTFEGIKKDMAKFKEDIGKAGVKLVFWGHPFGVSENLIAVFDIGGDFDNYLKVKTGVPSPYVDSRTELVLEH